MKKIIVDIDNTLSITTKSEYENAKPIESVINKLREYKKMGFTIVLFSSRNMRTFEGNVGKINIYTLPVLITWLNKYNVPFDEILVGKPWCGHDGFYIDDRAIRPSEFVKYSFEEITEMLSEELKAL